MIISLGYHHLATKFTHLYLLSIITFFIKYINQDEFNEANQLLFNVINFNEDYYINILDVMSLVNYILNK